MKILLALILSALTASSADMVFNWADAIGGKSNTTFTLIPARINTDGSYVVTGDTITWKGITTGTLTVTNLFGVGTNSTYAINLRSAKTNGTFYVYCPLTTNTIYATNYIITPSGRGFVRYVPGTFTIKTNGTTVGTITGTLVYTNGLPIGEL
jgi:hypothetical protein